MVESMPMRIRTLIASAALIASMAAFGGAAFVGAAALSASAQSAAGPSLLADRIDVSQDFRDFANAYYVADSVVDVRPRDRGPERSSGCGTTAIRGSRSITSRACCGRSKA